MEYVITTEKEDKFIAIDNHGKPTFVNNISKAKKYDYDKANNMIANNLTNYKGLKTLETGTLYFNDMVQEDKDRLDNEKKKLANKLECIKAKAVEIQANTNMVLKSDNASSITTTDDCNELIETIKLDESHTIVRKHQYQQDYIENVANEELADVDSNKENRFSYDITLLNKMLDEILDGKLKNEKKILHNQLIKISRASTDTSHYKEFKAKRDAINKCKLDTFESKLVQKRREIKDKISQIEIIEAKLKGKRVETIDTKIYTPRELADMFVTNEIPNFEEWFAQIER